jgi:hypothetical protein
LVYRVEAFRDHVLRLTVSPGSNWTRKSSLCGLDLAVAVDVGEIVAVLHIYSTNFVGVVISIDAEAVRELV